MCRNSIFKNSVLSILNDLDPDSEEAIYALKFINSCDRMNKMFWALMGDDDKITIPLEIPDLSEEEEWS